MKSKDVVRELNLKKGSKIKIIKMAGHPEMNDRSGTIINITGDYQLQGTWGSLYVNPSVDKIEKIN